MVTDMKHSLKDSIKNALKLVFILLPFVAAGGFFAGRYAFALLSEELQQLVLEQGIDKQMYGIISMMQSVGYAIFCGILGYILAEKTGLLKPFSLKKDMLIKSVVSAVICGGVFSLDYWTFGKLIPQVAESYESGILTNSMDNWISSVLYGGIVEELLLRFFLMSLVVLTVWRLFFKKYSKEEIPVGVFVAANAICAIVFAAGHLPATIASFGELSVLVLLRCFLLNGAFGFVYGELYRKFGIQYAIMAHMITHIVSKLIWLIF